jgi:hypothetical protein
MYRSHRIIAPIIVGAALVLGSGAVAFAAPGTPAGTGTARSNHAGAALARIAAVEGVTPQVLQQDLTQGETLLQIAGTKYANANALAIALLAPQKARLDAAVTAGRTTASQETARYNALLTKMETLVVTPHPRLAAAGSQGSFRGRSMGWGTKQVVQLVATTCNTTPAALTSLLHAGGTSVLAACQKTNSSATQAQLTALVFAPLQTKLNAAVAAGKITQTQAQQRATSEQLAIGKALTRTLRTRATAKA